MSLDGLSFAFTILPSVPHISLLWLFLDEFSTIMINKLLQVTVYYEFGGPTER